MPRPADGSVAYATDVARLLWPDPWDEPRVTRRRHQPGPALRDAYIFPSQHRPRVLVPADLPQSSVMVGRLGSGRSLLSGPARRVLERSLRSRAFPLARWPMLRVQGADPAADSIECHLAKVFGSEVRVGILLGIRRANQKPVLQVFGEDGAVLGYAKIGHNALTAQLLRQEADALREVVSSPPRTFRVPEVLHHGRWADIDVLVLSPLSTTPGCQVTPAALRAAMCELARPDGRTPTSLASSRFWSRLSGAVSRLGDTPEGLRLRRAMHRTEQRHGAEPVVLGRWHGDWAPWNMAMGQGRLHVWDWERYDAAVPVGFDSIHHAAQAVQPGQKDARRREATFLRSLGARLSDLGVAPSSHHLTFQLYLLEIAARYLDALAYGDMPTLERRVAWVLHLLEQELHHPEPA